jgi:hypothetical protein
MRNRTGYKDLDSLREDAVFSSEELELLLMRINEELEYASSDILRTWEKHATEACKTDTWRF